MTAISEYFQAVNELEDAMGRMVNEMEEIERRYRLIITKDVSSSPFFRLTDWEIKAGGMKF